MPLARSPIPRQAATQNPKSTKPATCLHIWSVTTTQVLHTQASTHHTADRFYAPHILRTTPLQSKGNQPHTAHAPPHTGLLPPLPRPSRQGPGALLPPSAPASLSWTRNTPDDLCECVRGGFQFVEEFSCLGDRWGDGEWEGHVHDPSLSNPVASFFSISLWKPLGAGSRLVQGIHTNRSIDGWVA